MTWSKETRGNKKMSTLIPSNIEILKNQTSIIKRNHILLKSRVGKKLREKSGNFDKNFTNIRIKRTYKILQYRNKKFYPKVV